MTATTSVNVPSSQARALATTLAPRGRGEIVSEINERIAALEAQLAVLKAEVGGAPDEEQSQTRRDVFKKFAIGAAGVAAGGALLAKATPAAAANTDNIKIGTQGGPINLGTLTTRVDYTGPATEGTGVVFQSGTSFAASDTITAFRSALGGWATNTGTLLNGVYGYSQVANGSGIIGYGSDNTPTSVGGTFRGRRAAINLNSSGAQAAITLAGVKKGDVLFTDEGDLWLADADGSLVRLGGSSTSGSAGELFLLDAPVRVYDSRPATNGPAATNDGPLGANAERAVSLANGFVGATSTPAVPAGATAALITLTVADTNGAGFLGVFSNALAAWPGTSNINWSTTGQAIATTTVSAVDAAAKIKVHAGGNAVGTNFVVDVTGFYG